MPRAQRRLVAETEVLFSLVLTGFDGPEHPDTITTQASFAITRRFLGRYSDAKVALNQVLNIREDQLGADHPDTNWTQGHLGAVY
jgi:hypothetical protein